MNAPVRMEVDRRRQVRRGLWRLAAVSVAVALLAACSTNSESDGKTRVKFTVVANDEIPGYEPDSQPRGFVVRDPKAAVEALKTTLAQPWTDDFPFDTSAAVIVLGGVQPTGSYTVVVDRLERAGSTLEITGSVRKPPPGPALQVLTEPFVALRVAKADVADVTNVTVTLRK